MRVEAHAGSGATPAAASGMALSYSKSSSSTIRLSQQPYGAEMPTIAAYMASRASWQASAQVAASFTGSPKAGTISAA